MLKIKFRCDDPPHSIDSLIRDLFGIPNEINYRLVDLSDECFVGLTSLSSLVDQTKILIKPWHSTKTASSSPQVIDNSARENASFSDNSLKISILDLSSPPQSSESDDNSIMNYVSTVSSEVKKVPEAQNKKNATNNKIKCNQKIYHFLYKYANLNKCNYY